MKNKNHSFLCAQFLGILLLCLYAFPKAGTADFTFISRFDALLSNLKFHVRGPKKPSGEVVVVAVDRESIETLGRWPWKRNATALLTESLLRLGVKNVGFDMGFMEIHADEFVYDQEFENTLKAYPDQITFSWWTHDLCEDKCLKEPLKESPPNAVSPSFSKRQIHTFENPELNKKMFSQHVKNQGFGNATKDADGQAREAYYFLRDLNGIYPSFPLALISQRLGKSPESLAPLAHSPIDYLGPGRTIPRFSALTLMQMAEEREVASEHPDLKGKTAIIGLTAFGLVDEQVSPFDKAIHGVEIQASIADQILRQSFPREPKLWVWIVTVLISFLLLFSTPYFKTKGLVGLFLSALAGFYFADFHILFPRGIFASTALLYANVSLLALSTLSGRFYEEFRQRKFLKDAFSKYLAPEVVQVLLSKSDGLSLGGEKKEITTLFCDLRNFTSLSEKLDPKDLMQVLNETFTVLTAVIFKHQGTVDKFIGDAIMAFFGAPLDQPDHAFRACMAAQEMFIEFKKKQNDFKERFGIELSLGIGINTGIAHVGNMGSEQRFNYTVLGDSVNVASRVESATKEFGVTILTTQATLDSIQKSGLAMPSHHLVAKATLKGKSQPLDLFELSS